MLSVGMLLRPRQVSRQVSARSAGTIRVKERCHHKSQGTMAPQELTREHWYRKIPLSTSLGKRFNLRITGQHARYLHIRQLYTHNERSPSKIFTRLEWGYV